MLPVLERERQSFSPADLPPATVEALYVHIPFCFHKCHYCDFYSITRQSSERMTRFVDLILRETQLWTRLDVRPSTVFFGGGTPTLLPIEQMARLLAGLRERIDLSLVDEWTVEANPATVSAEYCAMLRANGVDRISFGGQSFDRADLKLLERHHDPEDVPRSLELARNAGFKRLNVDLIFAIPGQTLESWEHSLEAAIQLGTSHLSCYGLTYEPNTPITVRRRLGQFQQAAESLELQMLRRTRSRLLEASMPAYEISNYASPGEECRHNLIYWTGRNYIGLGPSAASHVEGWRWRNAPHLGEWEAAASGDKPAAIEVEHLTPRQRAGELAMLMLRLSRGINFADFRDRTGFDAATLWGETIDRFSRVGLLIADESGFRLSDAGIAVADSLASEFVAASD